MKDLFVVSDIHGQIEQFHALLKNWDPSTQQLVIAGDMIDRGENAAAVVWLAKALKEKHNAIVLMGNHEEMFLHWLDGPDGEYCAYDTSTTIMSFLGETYWHTHTADHCRKELNARFPEEMDFLRHLLDYYETDTHIIVHAGVDLDLPDWKDTPASDMKWIRHEFHAGENRTGKTIVFGHTPTKLLVDPPHASHNVWVSKCKTKIGIDGGSYFGGLLHGLVITENAHEAISVDEKCSVTRIVL